MGRLIYAPGRDPMRLLPPLAILSLVFVALAVSAARTEWLPWSDECNRSMSCHLAPGETTTSLEAAIYYQRVGAATWFLQPGSAPYQDWLYIHNMSLGGLVAYLSSLLGATSMAVPILASIFAFCAGLFYGYLLVERASGSRALALVFLALMASEVWFNLVYGVNILRAWHWLPLFGSAYHLLRAASSHGRAVRSQLGLFAAYVGLGMLVGYEFEAVVFFLSIAVAILLVRQRRSTIFASVLVIFVAVFSLRQVQVIGGVGLNVWATDLYYSSVLKVPILQSLVAIPTPQAITAWYRDHHIYRGEAVQIGVAGLPGYIASLVASGELRDWLDRLGLPTLLAALSGVALALGAWVGRGNRARLSKSGPLMLALLLSQASVLFLLGWHAVTYFLVHEFPLIISSRQPHAAATERLG